MDDKVFVVFILFGCGIILCYDKSFYFRKYHYVNINTTWIDAQRYCRAHYTDLAKFESKEEMYEVKRPPMEAEEVWIGLNDDPSFWKDSSRIKENSWRWTLYGRTYQDGYYNWAPNKPDFTRSAETCVMVLYDGTWDDTNCYSQMSSVCYHENAGVKTYTLMENHTSFFGAVWNCRDSGSLYTDLALVESEEENTKLLSVTENREAWIGLFRHPWVWSDLTEVSGRTKNFKSGQPDNEQGNEHCVTEDSNHEWSDQQCDTERPFLCYDDVPIPTVRTVSVKFRSDVDLGDPVINSQILEQISALLKNRGVTNIKLKWRIQPKKDKEQVAVTTCD